MAAQGCQIAIVERPVDADIAQLVEDTRLALGHFGAIAVAQNPQLKVIALTGSSGKTTTKEMLGQYFYLVLAPTLITRGNLNNDLGVPMMLLELRQDINMPSWNWGASHQG